MILATYRDDQRNSERNLYTAVKASTTLQIAFKAFTDAQNKIRKALTDYNAQNTGYTQTAQDTFTGLWRKEETINPHLPALRRETKTLTATLCMLSEPHLAQQIIETLAQSGRL